MFDLRQRDTHCTYTRLRTTNGRPSTHFPMTDGERRRRSRRAYKCGERLTGGKRGEHLLPLLHRSSRVPLAPRILTLARTTSRSRSLLRRPHADCKQSRKISPERKEKERDVGEIGALFREAPPFRETTIAVSSDDFLAGSRIYVHTKFKIAREGKTK